MKRVLLAAALPMIAGVALAKLPPPDPAAKAKADETTAKAAWQAKVGAYKLCQVQDRIAARYGKKGGGAVPVVAKPAEPAAAPAPATAAPASGTPVAASPLPPCVDPGPFAYNPPPEKPLETSGAHSPSGTAGSPPSVRPESAEMAPAKKEPAAAAPAK